MTDLLPGLLAGRYQLGELIGRGGVGDVYRAIDVTSGRPVAVKFLRDTPGSDQRRFAAEVRTLEVFDHPNLVRLLDMGDRGGQAFLVTDLVDGGTLAHRIAAGPLAYGDTARIGAAVASALDYVHRRGVVHRDVKPGNILLGRGGEVRLADFGIARLVDAAGITTTGLAVGTPAYVAPEQIDTADVGPPADIYALGLVLLECLTGRRAYAGMPSEVAARRLQHGPDLSALNQPGWRFLIRGMTNRTPALRPPAADVRDLLRGLGSPPLVASGGGAARPSRGPGPADPAEVTTERFHLHVVPIDNRVGPFVSGRVGISAATEQFELRPPAPPAPPVPPVKPPPPSATQQYPVRPAAPPPVAAQQWRPAPRPPAPRPPGTQWQGNRAIAHPAPARAPASAPPRWPSGTASRPLPPPPVQPAPQQPAPQQPVVLRPGYVDWLIALIFVLLAIGIIAGYLIAKHATSDVPPLAPQGSSLVLHSGTRLT